MKVHASQFTLFGGLIMIGMIIGAVVPGHFARRDSGTGAAAMAKVTPPADAVALNRAFVAVANAVRPAVVNINNISVMPGRRGFDFFRGEFREQDREVKWGGSGVIIRSDGYLVTNNHVIRNMGGVNQQTSVTLADSRKFPARLIGTDPTSDIAVLKIDATGLPTASWGNSDKLQVGEWVIAIGSPLGFDQTVTAGIVSAKGRKGLAINAFEDFIQTDAAINRGNSGGPLLSIEGEIVGINTAIASQSGGSDGIGFAVPSAVTKSVVDILIAGGKVVRGWLGVGGRTVQLSDGQKQYLGVMVIEVHRGGPAEKAGIRQGDVLLSVDGKDTPDGQKLRNAAASAKIGAIVKARIVREGKTVERLITIEGAPVDPQTGVPMPGT